MDPTVLDWLLDPTCPPARYLALRDLVPGADPCELEPIGEPSRLLTLRWLWVRRAFGLDPAVAMA